MRPLPHVGPPLRHEQREPAAPIAARIRAADKVAIEAICKATGRTLSNFVSEALGAAVRQHFSEAFSTPVTRVAARKGKRHAR